MSKFDLSGMSDKDVVSLRCGWCDTFDFIPREEFIGWIKEGFDGCYECDECWDRHESDNQHDLFLCTDLPLNILDKQEQVFTDYATMITTQTWITILPW